MSTTQKTTGFYVIFLDKDQDPRVVEIKLSSRYNAHMGREQRSYFLGYNVSTEEPGVTMVRKDRVTKHGGIERVMADLNSGTIRIENWGIIRNR